jgi:hypothetical protein
MFRSAAASIAPVALSLFWIGATSPALAAEPSERPVWRPATARDVAATPPAPHPMPERARADVAPVASGQWAQIDPITNEIIPGPMPLDARPPLLPLRVAAPMLLRESPLGYLYVDTSDYRSVTTVRFDANGRLHTHCAVPAHGHEMPQGFTADSSLGQDPR